MNVRELINKLKTCNPNLKVIINGYEGGQDEINRCDLVKLKLNENKGWNYYGDHQIIYKGNNEEHDEMAIHLNYEQRK